MRFANLSRSPALLMVCAMVSTPALAVTLPAFDLPQIGSIDMPGTAKAGETVKLTVKAAKEGTSACGLLVKFGDGSDQQIKINVDNAKLPVSIEHVYTKAGKYTVQASGRKITTHHSCKGNASAIVQVTPVKPPAKAAAPKK